MFFVYSLLIILTASFELKTNITEVDGSGIFCEITI